MRTFLVVKEQLRHYVPGETFLPVPPNKLNLFYWFNSTMCRLGLAHRLQSSSQCLVFIPGLKIINRENLTDGCMDECGTMRRFLALFLFSCLIGVIKGEK